LEKDNRISSTSCDNILDIELPDYKSKNNTVLIFIYSLDKYNATFTQHLRIPVHLRYQRAADISSKDIFSSASITSPRIFYSEVINFTKDHKSIFTSEWNTIFMDKNINEEGLIPIGQQKHEELVTLVTFLITILSMLIILYITRFN